MSTGLNISGAVYMLLLLDYEFTNNFKKNTNHASILNVPSHSFQNTHYNIYPHLSNSFTINHNRQPIPKPESYNRLLFIIFRISIVSSASARTSQKYSLAELQNLPQ
jgi:hypothetical protein